jgi:RNA polymerase sigma factor (sigma-70 family)
VSADDDHLLRCIAARDMAAFEAFYQRYYRVLLRFVARVLRHPATVEEVVSDTLFAVWNQAAEFSGRSRVSTWVFGIAYRQALKALTRLDLPVLDSADDGLAEPLPGPEAILHWKRLGLSVDAALAELSPPQRAVVELTWVNLCSYREIAEILACPIDTVKTRMHHARRKLRLLLPDLFSEKTG